MSITPHFKSDDLHGLGGGWTFLFSDGTKLPRGFTSETTEKEVARFLVLCNRREGELLSLSKEYYQMIEWNIAHPGRGRDWPVFSKMQRLLNDLQKQAGIMDS